MWLELSVCLNSQGNFWEKTLLFLLYWKRQCGTRHVVCGDEKLAQVTRLLPSVTYLRTYLLCLQQPPVCLTLPGQSCCCSLWVNRDTLSSLFYFVCFIVSRTIYKYIFSIANIVVSEWWPLQPYPYHIGFRDGTKSVLGRKKKIEWNFKFCDLEGCAGCRSDRLLWIRHTLLIVPMSPVALLHCLLTVLCKFDYIFVLPDLDCFFFF